MELILKYISATLQDAAVAIPFVLIFRGIAVLYRRKKRTMTTVMHEAGTVFLLVFLSALFAQTISPRFGFDVWNIHFQGGINLTLFFAIKQILNTGNDNIILNLVGNVTMFMPIGFLIPLLWKPMAAMWKVVPLGLLISAFIECCQLFLIRGTDVDDLMLNSLGTLLGYLVFMIVRNASPYFIRRCRCIKRNRAGFR